MKSKRLAWWSGTCFVVCGIGLGFSTATWLLELPALNLPRLISVACSALAIWAVGYTAGVVHIAHKKNRELEALLDQTREDLAKLKQLQDAYRAALLGGGLELPLVGIAERKAH